MKYLYLIDYNVPFPRSEYGGLINIIASDDAECHEILLNERLWDAEHVQLIAQATEKARKFALSEDYKSGILEAFIT